LLVSTAAGVVLLNEADLLFMGGLPGQHQQNATLQLPAHFSEARESEWQWHQLGHVQVCSSLQTDNHASTPPLSFLQAGCPSCRPTNSIKALKAAHTQQKISRLITQKLGANFSVSGLELRLQLVNH